MAQTSNQMEIRFVSAGAFLVSLNPYIWLESTTLVSSLSSEFFDRRELGSLVNAVYLSNSMNYINTQTHGFLENMQHDILQIKGCRSIVKYLCNSLDDITKHIYI